MENHHAINGKTHYFYGHFQLQNVSSPEGRYNELVHGDFNGLYINKLLVGGLEPWNFMTVPSYWEDVHPN